MKQQGSEGGGQERRILDDMGSDSGFLAFVDLSNTDLLFLAPALVVAMLMLELIVIATGRFFVGIGLVVVVLGVAGLYVFVCPDHRTPLGLLWSFINHYRRDDTMTFTDNSPDPSTDTPTDVKELTRVRSVEPEIDGIRRYDETLIGAVRIEPANLALADNEQWDKAASDFGTALNALNFPVQIRSSSRRVDANRMTAAYDSRQTDPDVQSNPKLAEIVEVYRRRRPKEFRERGTSIRQYHAIIPVRIQAVSLKDHPWVRRLKSAPLVGEHLAPLLADWLVYDERRETIKRRQRVILNDRRTDLVDQLSSIEDVTAYPIAATDLAQLVEEYWSGRRMEYPHNGPHLRTSPVVLADHDTNLHRSPTDAATSSLMEDDHK